MMDFTESIYYVDKTVLKKIKSDFELIEKKDWFSLYRSKLDSSFWRLDEWDKYQEQFFTRIESVENWIEYNDFELRIQWLEKSRGTAVRKCSWENCDRSALANMAICAYHFYNHKRIKQ